MKKALLILFVLLLPLLFNSCDLLEIKRDYTYTVEIPVTGEELSFSAEKMLDASSDSSEFEQYDHMIESAELTKIEFNVPYFIGPDDQEISDASLEIQLDEESAVQPLTSISNVSIHALTHETQELPVDYSAVEEFNIVMEGKDFTIRVLFHGQTNRTPSDFKVRFIFTVTVTGQLI